MPFKINLENINEKKILQRINMRMRKQGKKTLYHTLLPSFQLQKNRSEESDIHSQRTIHSHRKILGPFLIKTRSLLDEEIQRSIEPTIQRQIALNKKLLTTIQKLEERLTQLERRMQRKK